MKNLRLLSLFFLFFYCLIFLPVIKAQNTATKTAKSSDFLSEDIEYKSGEIKLAGVLMIPKSSRKLPCAVIIQGSGSSDRTNQWARAISEVLVKNGVAVLLTDKRGSGKSEGNWQTTDFDALANDAVSGVKYLLNRKEIDSERIGLVGLSQGGWVAPLAASRSQNVAFVINISGSSVTFAEQSFTEMANTTRQAGFSESVVEEVLKLNNVAGEYLKNGNWEKYSKLREQALHSEWKNIAAGFPNSPNHPIWIFLRRVFDFDPLPYWMLIDKPILIIYGEKDEQDNVPVMESVRRLKFTFNLVKKENYQISVIPNAGHGFIDSQKKELMPSFIENLSLWVKEFVIQ